MPLTDTLKNAEDFRSVGFSDAQSNLLAHKIEEAISANNQDLKAFIRDTLAHMEERLSAKIESGDATLRAEFQAALRDQLLKFITVTVAVVSLAVAIIKLFPNAY